MKKLRPLTLKAKIKHLLQLIILLGVMFGCSDDQDQIIPYVNVNFSANLDLPAYNPLNSVNNAVSYPNAGYNHNGVMIYRNSTEEFTAYDATCPKHLDTKITAVKLDDGGSAGSATCPECKTVYYFFNYAYPSKGYPLKQYRVTKSGSTLYISN